MTRCAHLLDSSREPLWRDHLAPAADRSPCLLDLAGPPRRLYPRPHDLPGWRRWFRQQELERVHAYDPPARAWAILLAAARRRVPVRVYLTNPLDPWLARLARRSLWRAELCVCATAKLADHLRQVGVDPGRVTVRTPVVAPPLGPIDRWACRRRLTGREHGAVFLALDPPDHPAELEIAVWAAAILQHAGPEVTLIVSGRCTPAARRRLAQWRRSYDAPHLTRLDSETPWDALVPAADAVVAAGPSCRAVLRLLHARSARQVIVAPAGFAPELLEGYERVRWAGSPRPRHLAAAMLQLVEENRARPAG